METTYNHVQIGVVDANGNVNVLYPLNTAEDVSVDKKSNPALPANVQTLKDIIDSLGAMAFNDGSKLVYLAEGASYEGEQVGTEINDDTISLASAWSSKKVNTHTELFTPTYENDVDTINYLYATSAKKVVNGKDGNISGLCPVPGYVWFVDYTPYITSKDHEAGKAGSPLAPECAFERWVGHVFGTHGEEPVVYERIYMNRVWGPFKKVNVSYS